jgi:N-acetylmuramoyl-L-alanine amidase
MKKILTFIIITLLVSITCLAGSDALDESVAYMGGYPDGSFRPDGTITRAEAVTVLARLSGKEIANNESSFADLRGHWSENYVAHFEKENFFFFKTEGLFRPDLPITRGEFVALAVNIFDTNEKLDVSGFS